METLTIEILVQKPLEKVWSYFTEPEHIVHWYFATDDWHAPFVQNELTEGSTFTIRMEAKDGSMGFDFQGTYEKIVPFKTIIYHIIDGREVKTNFEKTNNGVLVKQEFQPESLNSVELQKTGWQMILNNFKKYAEEID